MVQNTFNPCVVPNQEYQIDDPPVRFCNDPCQDPSLRKIDLGLTDDECDTRDGAHALCDPMQTGQIVNDVNNPNRDVIYRYGKGIRGCDEAVLDLFRNIVVLDNDGKAHPVPVIWGTQERAVAAIIQENVHQDSDLIDRIKLPALAISSTGHTFQPNRYLYHGIVNYIRDFIPDGLPEFMREKREPGTLFGLARGIPVDISYTMYAWTLYLEDMNQILEQIITKFSPIAYIRVRGIRWEIGVKLDSIANNLDLEPGDKNLRVIKFQFNMTAETFIPQPIVRKKTVLRTRMDILDGLTEEDATRVITRIEESVKGQR